MFEDAHVQYEHAWRSVVSALEKAVPGFMRGPKTGAESAVMAIQKLARESGVGKAQGDSKLSVKVDFCGEPLEVGFHNWAVWKTRAETAEKKVEILERVIDRHSLHTPVIRQGPIMVQMRFSTHDQNLAVVKTEGWMGGTLVTVEPLAPTPKDPDREYKAQEINWNAGYERGSAKVKESPEYLLGKALKDLVK